MAAPGPVNPNELNGAQEADIKKEIIGGVKIEKLNDAQHIEEVCRILKNPEASFAEISTKIETIIDEYVQNGTNPEERRSREEDINRRIKRFVFEALRKVKNTLNQKKLELENKLHRKADIKREQLKGKPAPEIKQEVAAYIESLSEYTLYNAYQNLIDILDDGMPKEIAETAAEKAAKDAIKKAAKEKADKEAAEKATAEKEAKEKAAKEAKEKADKEAAEKAAQEKAAKEAAEKAAQEKAAKEAAEKAAQEKAAKEALIKKTKEKLGTKNSVDTLKSSGIRTANDIRRFKLVFGNVVDAYDANPSLEQVRHAIEHGNEGEDAICWRKDNKKNKPLNKRELQAYVAFQEYMEKQTTVEEAVFESIREKTVAERKFEKGMGGVVNNEAKDVVEDLCSKYPQGPDRAMLWYVLGANDKKSARDKVAGLLLDSAIPEVRKGKAIYEELKIESERTVAKLLDEPYGEIMHSNTIAVLKHLYENAEFKKLAPEIEGFQDILIEVLKTKGGMALEKTDTYDAVTAQTAANIYRRFLLVKNPKIVEKETLAILIALRKDPPFVFDLANTHYGWVAGNKKMGPEVFDDFIKDGEKYAALRKATGLPHKKFNEFIGNIVGEFEALRSVIEELKKESMKVQPGKKAEEYEKEKIKINAATVNKKLEDLGAEKHDFKDHEIETFKKMMEGDKNWIENVGPAYKHALYLKEQDQHKIPHIMKIQGPDVKVPEQPKPVPKIKNIEVVVVDIKEKRKRIANRKAAERLDKELKERGPQKWFQVWRIPGKWWMRNAAQAYLEEYEKEEFRKLKLDDLNEKELDALAERFGISWNDAEQGKTLLLGDEKITPATEAQAAIISDRVKGIIKDAAEGRINDATFKQRMRDILADPQLQVDDQTLVAFLQETVPNPKIESGQPLTPEEIKNMGLLDKIRAHRKGLLELDLKEMNLAIALGKAQNVDVKTDIKDLGTVDKYTRKFVEKIQRNKFLGRFISPPTMAMMAYGISNIATSVAMNKAVRFSLPILGAVIAPTAGAAVLGVAGGILAGGLLSYIRRNKEQLHLKAQKERRRALGYRPSDDDRGITQRYERKLENRAGVLYPQENVDDLIGRIDTALSAANTTPDINNFNALINTIAHAAALNEVSEMGLEDRKEKIDLINFKKANPEFADNTEAQDIERKRLQLLRKIAEGKIRLNHMATAGGINEDPTSGFNSALKAAKDDIGKKIAASETAFKKFKRVENIKSAAVGAVIGGWVASAGWLLFPQVTDSVTGVHDLKPGTVPGVGMTGAEFQQALISAKFNPAQIADIKTHLQPDATGHIPTVGIDYVKDTYGLQINQIGLYGQATQVIDTPLVNSGNAPLSKTEFINALNDLNTKGKITITPAEINGLFDAKGHITPAGIAFLKAKNVNIQEVISTTPGVPGSPSTLPSAWETVKTHFHGHKKPALDELRLLWNGKPQLQNDGYHFTIKDMFDPSKTHTKLPSGLSMPSDPSGMRIGLQIKEATGYKWTFISPDSNGNVVIPKEYFDTGKIGYVPKGGSILPGLKANALAVGFKDAHNDYHVMASVKGDNSLIPSSISTEQAGFKGEFVRNEVSDGTLEAKLTTTEKVLKRGYWSNVGGLFAGGPMEHLEYGKEGEKKEAPQPTNRTETPVQAAWRPVQAPTPQAPQTPQPPLPEQVNQVRNAPPPKRIEIMGMEDIPALDIEKALAALANSPFAQRIVDIEIWDARIRAARDNTQLQREFEQHFHLRWTPGFAEWAQVGIILEAIWNLDNWIRQVRQNPHLNQSQTEAYYRNFKNLVGADWREGFDFGQYRNAVLAGYKIPVVPDLVVPSAAGKTPNIPDLATTTAVKAAKPRPDIAELPDLDVPVPGPDAPSKPDTADTIVEKDNSPEAKEHAEIAVKITNAFNTALANYRINWATTFTEYLGNELGTQGLTDFTIQPSWVRSLQFIRIKDKGCYYIPIIKGHETFLRDLSGGPTFAIERGLSDGDWGLESPAIMTEENSRNFESGMAAVSLAVKGSITKLKSAAEKKEDAEKAEMAKITEGWNRVLEKWYHEDMTSSEMRAELFDLLDGKFRVGWTPGLAGFLLSSRTTGLNYVMPMPDALPNNPDVARYIETNGITDKNQNTPPIVRVWKLAKAAKVKVDDSGRIDDEPLEKGEIVPVKPTPAP